MLLMIDNYDSFTFNLVQYFGELGVDVKVARNDEIELAEIESLSPKWIVISPGPCSPTLGGYLVGCHQSIRGKGAAFWRVPGASVYRTGIWWHCHLCENAYAWENVFNCPYVSRCF